MHQVVFYFFMIFFFALSRCCAFIGRRENFPFGSQLFCLFFKRFSMTRPYFDQHPPRLMTDVRMHMWGKMMPKRGQSYFPARITVDVLDMIGVEEQPRLDMDAYPHVGLEWRAVYQHLLHLCKPLDDRGKFNVMFKLIQFCFILFILNVNEIYFKLLY